MALAPEPYLSACLAVMHRAILDCRARHWGKSMSAEETADLMDAVHNLPWLIQNWERCEVEFLRRDFLQVYDRQWLTDGGFRLCELFDLIVAGGKPQQPQ
jgi:hypothetical protein